jgi:hypothetical protein
MIPTQRRRLEMLLRRPKGTTSWEIIQICRTTSPHRRLTDLEESGWVITRLPVDGAKHLRYFGKPPKGWQ